MELHLTSNLYSATWSQHRLSSICCIVLQHNSEKHWLWRSYKWNYGDDSNMFYRSCKKQILAWVVEISKYKSKDQRQCEYSVFVQPCWSHGDRYAVSSGIIQSRDWLFVQYWYRFQEPRSRNKFGKKTSYIIFKVVIISLHILKNCKTCKNLGEIYALILFYWWGP